MEIRDKVIVVTGGANGIGRALCRRFASDGPRALFVADVDKDGAVAVARETSGVAVGCDVSREADIKALVDQVISREGRIDLFCSNAGIAIDGGPEVDDADWDRIWRINALAHVLAAGAVLPGMLEQGDGYLLQTVSAAGLLTQIGSAPYSVTKHAALAFAEWLSITYGDAGLKVSVLAPQAVRTAMTAGVVDGGVAGVDGMLEPEDVATAVV